jgi:hypothetical protein
MVSGCNKTMHTTSPFDPTGYYIFLGHTYETNTRVDERLLKLDYSKYEQIWLGGDICAETTKEESTVEHIDDVFDIGSQKTHWALGNHDIRNGNVNWITERTKRPTYYTTHFDGITLMILNTNFSFGGIYDTINVKTQFEMIQNVCDTISESSHLIILSHNAVWDGIDQIANLGNFANANFSFLRFNFDPEQRYKEAVYPLLINVRKRGVEVIHIAGDFGQEAASYEFLTSDSIQFIGSGITSNTAWNQQFSTAGIPDSILVLYHDKIQRTVSWGFEELN